MSAIPPKGIIGWSSVERPPSGNRPSCTAAILAAHVRFGSIATSPTNVRFTPESGHALCGVIKKDGVW